MRLDIALIGLIASIALLICKLLWLKAFAKWLNVNVIFAFIGFSRSEVNYIFCCFQYGYKGHTKLDTFNFE